MKTITTISGDGIGKEVMEAGIFILDSLDLNFEYKEAIAGRECFNTTGETIPEESIKTAKKTKCTLFGAITSTPGQKSPIITLRKELDVYGNLRPIKSMKGVKCLYDNIDLLIVRENTEGLYSQIEKTYKKNNIIEKSIAKRIITKKASERICKLGFDQAVKRLSIKEHNKTNVTCVHKSNVLKKTDGIFKKAFYNVAKNYSKRYPKLIANDYYVDATAMYLITKPQEFNVIITTNLFGDVLSDEGAGLVGGLGMVPSGNIGEEYGLFEPVHGSAPDIAGKNISNPIAMILSIAMMLDYLNEPFYAEKVKKACEKVLEEGKVLTPDIGGNAKTIEVAKAIADKLDL